MKVSRSKTGLPTLCESGGGSSNTGSATIIAGPHGEPLKALFVPKGYCNGDHVIFVVAVEMVVVTCGHDRSGESVEGVRIKAIGTLDDPDELITSPLFSWENGDGNVPLEYEGAVKAAREKAHDYHCRRPYFLQ